MRVAQFLNFSLLVLLPVMASTVATAATPDDKLPDPATIAALEAQATAAPQREQCFLYARITRELTELAGRQYREGNSDKAQATVSAIQGYARKITAAICVYDKRIKKTEILLRHTSYRLKELLYGAPADDRARMAEALARLDEAQNIAMLQVFEK